VSPTSFIDKAIYLAKEKGCIVTTFGDLLRVPGSTSNLEKEKSRGKDVRIVYSIADALTIAENNPSKKVVFLAVGFETTAPTTALALLKARAKKLDNFFLFLSHRLIPPALDILAKDPLIKVQGFLLPGHVSTIIGVKSYSRIAEQYQIGCVIAGFEALDIMSGICMLIVQIKDKSPKVENEYLRVVKKEGNVRARRLMDEVFKVDKAYWRGLGYMDKSGLFLKKEFQAFSAEKFIDKEFKEHQNKNCLCGEVVKGKISPLKCPQFRKKCTPLSALGPCMVSFEGTCRIYYEYHS